MTDVVTFSLVSPEKHLASSEANSISLPGIEGDLTILPNHATFLTVLRPGILSVNRSDGIDEYIVTGGFVEVSDSRATVLAEKSVPKAEVTAEFLSQLLKDAESDMMSADEKKKARIALRVNDLKLLREQLGKS